VSPNTVRTHIRSLYAKLGTHHRAETVELTRALGLLAPPELVARPPGRNEKWPETGTTEPFWKIKTLFRTDRGSPPANTITSLIENS
jgi:hypothetical protein